MEVDGYIIGRFIKSYVFKKTRWYLYEKDFIWYYFWQMKIFADKNKCKKNSIFLTSVSWSHKQCLLLLFLRLTEALWTWSYRRSVCLCVCRFQISRSALRLIWRWDQSWPKAIHTQEATENGSHSAPVLRLELSWHLKRRTWTAVSSLFLDALLKLHLTDTTLRLPLTLFHVWALCFFIALCVTSFCSLGWYHCTLSVHEARCY